MKRKKNPEFRKPTLGELILAVSSVSREQREAIAAVADLLENPEKMKRFCGPHPKLASR